MAFEQLSGGSPRLSTSRCTRFRRVPRCSIGPSRASGTSATPTSRTRAGSKIVDFARSNLHLMSYSIPVRKHLSLEELRTHLYSLPQQPDLIPYRTSYYAENWGFCLPHRQLESLKDETYEVVIDSRLEDGFLTYGEFYHRGETEDEVLLSAHICHPSLANDNCSGLALLAHLANRIGRTKTRYSYRFLFAPGSIGALTWLSRNEAKVSRIKHGLVVSGVGDGAGPTYKRSRRGSADIDRAMVHVLKDSGHQPTILDFSPYGYDERQYCSPGFDLAVGLFQRGMFGTFPEYHTSADNLDFIRPANLETSYRIIAGAIEVLEGNFTFENTSPKGEPHLGKRGLYGAIGGDKNAAASIMTMLWVLNLSDGRHTLLDIAERAELPFADCGWRRCAVGQARSVATSLMAEKRMVSTMTLQILSIRPALKPGLAQHVGHVN